MKKFLVLLLSITMLLSLFACSETDNTASTESKKNKPPVPEKNEPKIVYSIKADGDEEIYALWGRGSFCCKKCRF